MPAIILHHTRHHVTLHDPREQPVLPDPAPAFTPPTDDEMQRLDAYEALYRLITQHGADRVARWVRSLAAIAGQDCERPANRCLADGGELFNSICVRCGRDNS